MGVNWAELGEGFASVLAGERPVLLLHGLWMTLQVSFVSLMLGVVVGAVLALCRLLRLPVLSPLATAYVEVVRGIPLLVQLSVVYYGLPKLGITLEAYPSVVLALGLYSGAYVSEIFRGGLNSVPLGQFEAAQSLGLSRSQSLRLVIVPQALIAILPALGNEFISLILGSSLASVVTLTELFRQGGFIIAQTYRYFEVYFVLAVLYSVLTFALGRIMKALEKRYSRGMVAVHRRVI